jgi:CRP/FNR family transcriptional regulator
MATDLLLLSPQAFDAACADADFRALVLGTLADRLVDVVLLAEAVAFQRLDRRLAALLADRAPRLTATHQALADELGTVREIVSRLLRRFEQAGWISLGRERIEVHDATALRALAQRPGD